MSNDNDTELPQASPEATIEDKLNPDIQDKLAELLDSYFPEHKDCECSRCLAFIYGLKEAITTETTRKEHEARMNLLEYFDQIPKNEHMDWKGLIADCKRLLKEEQE